MAEFGLLGRKLNYSLSKKIHEAYGLYDYELFEREADELDDFFENRCWRGINVTIPYKLAVEKYCDIKSDIVKRTASVNTIYERDGKLVADNTDFYGFLHLLNASGSNVRGKKVLILGRGGAARTVCEAMKERRAACVRQSSRQELKDLSAMADAEIIVNATPVGTAGTELEGMSPCDLSAFPKLELVIDLVYRPALTPLLKQAKNRGIRFAGGMEMLKFQAEKAARRFMSTKRIVLIGMPGCGKSHVGRLLAAKSGRKFFDSDMKVKEFTGSYPAELIARDGEEAFRKIESRALAELLKNEAAVIATGGGILGLEENRRALRNELLVWLRRDLDKLSVKRRPLSGDLEKLYEKREPLYESCADVTVDNNGTPEECAARIKKVCKI